MQVPADHWNYACWTCCRARASSNGHRMYRSNAFPHFGLHGMSNLFVAISDAAHDIRIRPRHRPARQLCLRDQRRDRRRTPRPRPVRRAGAVVCCGDGGRHHPQCAYRRDAARRAVRLALPHGRHRRRRIHVLLSCRGRAPAQPGAVVRCDRSRPAFRRDRCHQGQRPRRRPDRCRAARHTERSQRRHRARHAGRRSPDRVAARGAIRHCRRTRCWHCRGRRSYGVAADVGCHHRCARLLRLALLRASMRLDTAGATALHARVGNACQRSANNTCHRA